MPFAYPTVITDPADVTFAYDNLGNRTQMTDAMGTQTYTYDPLSRMTSETRDFTDTLADEPSSGVYRIEYTYTLGGNLKTLKDPWNQQFNYSHDSLGRLQSIVSSASFDGLTNYAQSPVYNARGQLTGVSYGNGVSMSVTGFNAKLQATGIEIKKGATPYVKKAYEFNSDGSLRFVEDLIDDKFDRFYKYDHQGRTVQGRSGVEARGGTVTNAADRIDVPYMRSYSYNTFGQITLQSGWYYNTEDAFADSYTNNRSAENSYDNDGHTVSDPSANYKYDAAGRTYETAVIDWDTASPLAPTADHFDGDSRVSKRIRNLGSTSPAPETTYYVYSSVLGRVISETDGTGRKSKTYVSANGATLAEQSVTYSSGTVERLTFVHQDASDTSVQQTKANGDLVYANARTAEHDPMGRNVADAGPYVTLNGVPPSTEGDLGFGIELFPSAQGYRPGQPKYLRDGVPVSADYFMSVIDSGAIGGLFGLVQMNARMGARVEGWRRLPREYSGPPGFNGSGGREIIPSGADAYATFNTNEGVVTNYYQAVYSDSWGIDLSLIPFQTKQTQFVLGTRGTGFSESETKALRSAFSKVNTKECLDWMNSILEKHIRFWDEAGQTGTRPMALSAKELLSKVELNKYSHSLTAVQMGLSERERAIIKKKEGYISDGFVGVNVGDQVWLTDIAFKSYSGIFTGAKVDLAASIIHELLHAFGFEDENYVKGLNPEIQKHCGTSGTVGGD